SNPARFDWLVKRYDGLLLRHLLISPRAALTKLPNPAWGFLDGGEGPYESVHFIRHLDTAVRSGRLNDPEQFRDFLHTQVSPVLGVASTELAIFGPAKRRLAYGDPKEIHLVNRGDRLHADFGDQLSSKRRASDPPSSGALLKCPTHHRFDGAPSPLSRFMH